MERVLVPRRSNASVKDFLQGFMTVTAAAGELGVTDTRVRRLCREGRFPGAAKLGAVWYIPRASVRGHKRVPPGRPKTRRARTSRTFEELVTEYRRGNGG